MLLELVRSVKGRLATCRHGTGSGGISGSRGILEAWTETPTSDSRLVCGCYLVLPIHTRLHPAPYSLLLPQRCSPRPQIGAVCLCPRRQLELGTKGDKSAILDACLSHLVFRTSQVQDVQMLIRTRLLSPSTHLLLGMVG